jgi:5-methylcytosine-specific restriction endonuclease McrA
VVANGKQVYCSRDCRVGYNRRFSSASALRRTARRWKDPDAERFTMLDIADRDGWVCGLCLGPIDPNIRGDRFRQATVDHILPLSQGGRHYFDNVQLAHWTCNAAKRNSVDVATMSVPSEERRVIARWPEGQPPSPPIGGPVATRTPSPPA